MSTLNYIILLFIVYFLFIHTAGEAESKGLRAGDMLLEVNGASVKDCSHQEAGKLIAKDSSMGVVLLIRTVKPTITPSGKVVYADWLYKKGGTGLTPRNWRKRWFVVRDDCVAYYYPSSEVRGEKERGNEGTECVHSIWFP